MMISSPEAAKFVLVTKSHLFKPTFPASKERMLGKQAIFFHQGDYHAKLRKLVLRAFMPDSVRNMVPHIESIAQESLSSWDGTQLNTYQEMKTVSPTPFSIFKNRVSSVFTFLSLKTEYPLFLLFSSLKTEYPLFFCINSTLSMWR